MITNYHNNKTKTKLARHTVSRLAFKATGVELVILKVLDRFKVVLDSLHHKLINKIHSETGHTQLNQITHMAKSLLTARAMLTQTRTSLEQ